MHDFQKKRRKHLPYKSTDLTGNCKDSQDLVMNLHETEWQVKITRYIYIPKKMYMHSKTQK